MHDKKSDEELTIEQNAVKKQKTTYYGKTRVRDRVRVRPKARDCIYTLCIKCS